MIDHANDCRVVLDGECTCRPSGYSCDCTEEALVPGCQTHLAQPGEWDLITDNQLTQDPATAVPVRGRRIVELVRHTHITRDIKPRGECAACDEYWSHADKEGGNQDA